MKPQKIFILFIVLLSFLSCQKPGCPDKTANNFCSSCSEDYTYCKYIGQLEVVISSDYIKSIYSSGVRSLQFYLSQNYVANISEYEIISMYSDADLDFIYVYNVDLGKSHYHTFNFKIYDQNKLPLKYTCVKIYGSKITTVYLK